VYGVHAMFLGLDERVSWDDIPGTLELHTRVEEERRLEGEGLVLMPSSFVWPDIVAITERPWRPTAVYPARGVAARWSGPVEPDHPRALSRLLGARRAAILQLLRTPSTTARLARTLSISPPTVSEHLAVLHDAGLVSRRRVGRSVEYQLTPRGSALIPP
jgi:DNA-binding transcriptional ArsR family regulator